jgi:hypothetical protein
LTRGCKLTGDAPDLGSGDRACDFYFERIVGGAVASDLQLLQSTVDLPAIGALNFKYVHSAVSVVVMKS